MLGEDLEDEKSKNLPADEAEKSFSNKHVLKRMAIVAAGPLFNLGLALSIFFALYLILGIHVMIPEIGQVRPDSPADNAGLMKGDVVISIQGKKIKGWLDIKELIHDKGGIPLEMTVKRVDKLVTLTVIPEETTQDVFGQEVKSALIGIVSSGEVKKIEPSPLEAMKEATMETWRWIERICLFIIKLFQGGVSIKMLGGPIMIGQMTGQIAQESFGYLVKFMAIISINLGILNLFPIPILDGGLIIFLFVELLLGKPVSLKKRELAQKVGLMFLILLMIIVTYNDLTRIKLFEKFFG
jgi:regulator of sigma E protease